jgi:dTMP kinase
MEGRAPFITVEGIDGAGKSTAVGALESHFDDVKTTKEPSNLWTGEQVYRAIGGDETPPLTDFYLFMADRVHHIDNLIKPALNDGTMVVSDRFADSTRAYQNTALGEHMMEEYGYESEPYIESLMEPWNMEPDLTLFLDISVDTSLERCEGGDKYEKREFLTAVRSKYKELENKYDRFVTVDAERPKDHVCGEVIGIVEELRE